MRQENVFDNPLAPIDSASTLDGRMPHPWNLNATFGNPMRLSTGRPVARSQEQNTHTIPKPRFARKPSTRNFLFPAEGVYPQNKMVDQQRLQISELHFDKFPTPSTFSSWKIRFKTQVSACSRSPSEAMLWIKEVEMVDSVDDLKSWHSIHSFPELLDAGCEDCGRSGQDHPEFLLQEKSQPGGTENSKRGSVPSRKTDRLHDLRLLLDYAHCIHKYPSQW